MAKGLKSSKEHRWTRPGATRERDKWQLNGQETVFCVDLSQGRQPSQGCSHDSYPSAQECHVGREEGG